MTAVSPKARVRSQPSNAGAAGNGAVIAAGAVIVGGIALAGVALGTAAMSEGGLSGILDPVAVAEPAPVDAPPAGDKESPNTVTLPDQDQNGIPDGMAPVVEDPTGQDADPAPTTPPLQLPEELPTDSREATTVYIIEPGDTLSEISANSGVPLDVLVEQNDVPDPDLIYAGASLLVLPG